MASLEKLIADLKKLSLGALAVVVFGGVIQESLSHLTLTTLLVVLVGLVAVSPVAYLLLRSDRPESEHRPRRGAERTPLLPPQENNE